MLHLFPNEKIILPLPDAHFEYYPSFFNKNIADELFETLIHQTPWQHDAITMFGKKIMQPRLTAFYSDNNKSYSYSNITMVSNKWNTPTQFIKDEIELKTSFTFNSVLLNFYRNEKDSNGWHADNEKDLGLDPIIASVSFGESRVFQLKHNTKPIKQNIVLNHGDLFIMGNGSQNNYKHQLPKSKEVKKERINLTFRTLY